MARFLSITPTSELTFKIMYIYCSQSFKSFTYQQHTLLPFVWLPSSLPMLVLYRFYSLHRPMLCLLSVGLCLILPYTSSTIMAMILYRFHNPQAMLRICVVSLSERTSSDCVRILCVLNFANRLSHFPESLRMVTSHRDVSWFLFLG